MVARQVLIIFFVEVDAKIKDRRRTSPSTIFGSEKGFRWALIATGVVDTNQDPLCSDVVQRQGQGHCRVNYGLIRFLGAKYMQTRLLQLSLDPHSKCTLTRSENPSRHPDTLAPVQRGNETNEQTRAVLVLQRLDQKITSICLTWRRRTCFQKVCAGFSVD